MHLQPDIQQPTPAPLSTRINEIDIIRGLALLGILTVNIGLFSFPVLYANPQHYWSAGIDRICDKLVYFLGEGKFISIFSFLFGLGFTIFMQRALAKTDNPKLLFARRLVILLLIGMIHANLIWYGDVLCIYSLLGFLLMLFWHMSPERLFKWAAGIMIVFTVVAIGISLIWGATQPDAPTTAIAGIKQAEEAVRHYQSGTLREIFWQNQSDLWIVRIGYTLISPQIFTMFLLGAYAGKRKLFSNLRQHTPFIRRVQTVSLATGLPLAIIGVIWRDLPASTGSDLVQLLESYFAGPAMGIFYIATLALLLQSPGWKPVFSPLAAVGRMAATNYIMQSVLCIFIFYHFGLGLYGKTSPARDLLIVAAIYALQILLSNAWLKRFKYGPVEWCWRTLTYYGMKQARPID
ncbi:MAG TPA: DUF418 domain-containing protein [Chitinophaga sp.]|uniref:DUF418 domain-containing protein n=1 Tax=Chitinophaga sp. TaxID=1869181 RepID=UPI002CBDEE1F|nr:DUF418 domain-containing protein [Chitinophaga sp.]HVI45787.1 DUF418 domain-containing protein [Chitinophaga sp.]